MKHFLLIYDYVPDYLEKRTPLRPAHLELARAATERGELELGGAVPNDDPPFGLLLFRGESPQVAEDFARADPYVTNGVVKSWRVREWVAVVGTNALTKV
ncbi:MAG: YciI family protein [Hyphomonadaceae bacterium]|nr:YciI family protein [Hyphomonadaceae bacterium]